MLNNFGVVCAKPLALLLDLCNQVGNRALVPKDIEVFEVHDHPLPKRHGVHANVVLRSKAIDLFTAIALGLLDVSRANALDLGKQLLC